MCSSYSVLCRGVCVDTVHECELASFVTGGPAQQSTELVPFVFLPLSGQLVYPRYFVTNSHSD